MAISVADYLAELHASVAEVRPLLERIDRDRHEISQVAWVNCSLASFLVWSWRSGDVDTCARILGVMELGLVDTSDDDYAPVYNTVSIGVIETLDRDLMRDELAAFIDTWPPTMKARGLPYLESIDDEYDASEAFPVRRLARLRWALRHPIYRWRSRRRFTG